jgi:hypothetical protein
VGARCRIASVSTVLRLGAEDERKETRLYTAPGLIFQSDVGRAMFCNSESLRGEFGPSRGRVLFPALYVYDQSQLVKAPKRGAGGGELFWKLPPLGPARSAALLRLIITDFFPGLGRYIRSFGALEGHSPKPLV